MKEPNTDWRPILRYNMFSSELPKPIFSLNGAIMHTSQNGITFKQKSEAAKHHMCTLRSKPTDLSRVCLRA